MADKSPKYPFLRSKIWVLFKNPGELWASKYSPPEKLAGEKVSSAYPVIVRFRDGQIIKAVGFVEVNHYGYLWWRIDFEALRNDGTPWTMAADATEMNFVMVMEKVENERAIMERVLVETEKDVVENEREIVCEVY